MSYKAATTNPPAFVSSFLPPIRTKLNRAASNVCKRTGTTSPTMSTSLFWEPAKDGKYNASTVTGGFDRSVFKKLQVVRVVGDGASTPGFLRDGDKTATAAVSGTEVKAATYETLVNPQDVYLEWIKPDGDTIPTGAVKGGKDKNGKDIFIARGKSGGDYVPGKMVPTDAADACFVAVDGKEVKFDDFEVLCINYVTPMTMIQ